jgi:hypothetical protein
VQQQDEDGVAKLDAPGDNDIRQLIGAALRLDAYTNPLMRRFQRTNSKLKIENDEAIALAGGTSVDLNAGRDWVKKEVARLFSWHWQPAMSTKILALHQPLRTVRPLLHRRRQDGSGIACTPILQKVLLDFIRNRLDPTLMSP